MKRCTGCNKPIGEPHDVPWCTRAVGGWVSDDECVVAVTDEEMAEVLRSLTKAASDDH